MNKKETVYEALTNIKREYVEEAESFEFKKRRISWQRVLGIAAAACLVVAMAAIAIIPKRERGQWAANNPTAAPISSGAPTETNEPTETDAPISTGEPVDEKLLVFHRPNSLIEFFAAPELSDAEFARFIRANGYERFGIVTKDDLRAVIDLMNEIPFPIRADLDFNVFHIKLDGETNSYCAQYWLDEGGIGRVCAFSGDLRGELSSADMIDRISNSGEPVDFAEHEHIKRLNLRRDDETFRFMADIDGRLVNISLQAHSVEEALETVLAFDFGRMGDNPPSIVASLWSGIENLNFCFESREELAAFISSLDMQDAEFNGFIEKYNDYFVNTKADVRAVLSKAEGIVFPQPEGRIFNLMGIGLSSELEGTFSLRYDLSKGKELRIDIYSDPNSRLEDMGAEVFAVELNPSSPIRELRGVSRKTALGDGRWREEQHFSGRLGERFIRIEAMNCTRSEAESLIRSFGYETLESLAFPSNTDSELPYCPIYLTGLDELKGFASAAAMSDAEFERYLERNAQNMLGIRSPIDAARALEYLDSLPFPISADQALGSIVFTPADGEYIIHYDTCSFRSCAEYGENGMFATFDEIAAALDVSMIDTGAHTHIGRLCKLNRNVPEEYDEPTYYAEIDGKLVEITAVSRPAEKAVEEILSFDFGSASELIGNSGQTQSVYTNDWFIDTAWEYARLANEVHGYAFTKQSASQWRSGEQRTVSFHTEEDERLSVAVLRDHSGEWFVEYNIIMGKWPEDGEFDDLNVNWDELRFDGVSVTKAELERAGYTLSGGDDDLIAVSQYCGDLISAKYTGCSEDNALRCYEARAISPRLISLPLFSNGYAESMVRLRLRPVNTRVFTWAHGDNECAIAGADDEMPGYMCDGISLRIERTEDGFNCLPGVYDGTVNWCNISLVDDPMGILQLNIGRILAENADSSSIESDGMWIIRLSYGMDWEWFEREYGEAAWPKLVERLKPGSITREIESRTMCMLAMRGALNAPEKNRSGFGELLAHQRAHDEGAFSYCLSELSEQQRAVIDGIVGN